MIELENLLKGNDMDIQKLINELNSKNDDICKFLKITFKKSNINIDDYIFDLLDKKLQNHDKLIVDAIKGINQQIEKIVMTITKSYQIDKNPY